MPAYTSSQERRELEGLRNLDPQVIGAIYDRYFSAVYRYVFYRLGDEMMAEDIAGETFVRLLEAVRKQRAPRSNVRGWLFSTASHLVNDHLRRAYRRPEETLTETMGDGDPSPAEVFDERERLRFVRAALSELTPEQQHVLALRFGQGYSLQETAAVMNKKVNAVKALQFRALAALQRKIGEVKRE